MGDAHYPSVRLGKIDNPNCYEKTMLEGVDIYYLDRLPTLYTTLNIKLEKLLFFETLVVQGEK